MFYGDSRYHPLSNAVLPVREGRVCGGQSASGHMEINIVRARSRSTGERYNERGEHPNGYLSYAADGRMYAIITWDNRAYPRDVVPTNEERIKLYGTMISYAGTYTMDADKVIHHVDISWNQIWTGTDQIRFYKLDGNILTITSAPNRNPVDGRAGRSILVWEKIP